MFGLKGKFNRARARVDSAAEVFGTMGTGILTTAVGVFTAPVDFGATAALGVTTLGKGIHTMTVRKPPNYSDFKGYFEFDDKTYYLGKRQWHRLKELDSDIKVLEKVFYREKRESQRKKINKKIQKLVDAQIDILKSKNISETPPETIELKINRSFSKQGPTRRN